MDTALKHPALHGEQLCWGCRQCLHQSLCCSAEQQSCSSGTGDGLDALNIEWAFPTQRSARTWHRDVGAASVLLSMTTRGTPREEDFSWKGFLGVQHNWLHLHKPEQQP